MLPLTKFAICSVLDAEDRDGLCNSLDPGQIPQEVGRKRSKKTYNYKKQTSVLSERRRMSSVSGR